MEHLILTMVGARNLKGQTFELELSPSTFLVGSNFTGKTARTDAIRLLLTGYLPELGKTNASTFGLSSGKELLVWGTIKDTKGHAYQISRKWYVKGDSIKSESDVPPAFADSVVEVMLNAESWFGLSERERVDWVYLNAPVDSKMERADVFKVARISIASMIEEDEIKVDEGMVDAFFDRVRDRVDELEHDDGPGKIADYVEMVTDIGVELVKMAKAQASVSEKGIQNLAGLRASDVAPVDLAAIEEEIKKINIDLDVARGKSATATAAYDTERANRSRRAALKKDLEGKQALETQKADVAAKIVGFKEKLVGIPVVDHSDIAELRNQEKTHVAEQSAAVNELFAVNLSIQRHETELAGIDSKTECPYCGASGDGWKSLKTSEINSTLAGLRSKKTTLEEKQATAKASLSEVEARISSKLGFQRDRDHYNAHVNAHERTAQTIETSLAGLTGKSEQLDGIPGDDPTLTDRMAEINASIRSFNEKLGKLDADRRAALGRSNDLKRLAESEKARDDAKIEQKIANEAVDTFRAVKAKMVAEAFAPLVAAANAFCGELLKTPIAFNAERSEIGTFRDGLWVGHRTFSGVERLLAYAGIQAAFASRSTVRVMILDEMLRAQGDLFFKIVGACKMAVRNGMIENFVGVIPGQASAYGDLVSASLDGDCKLVPIT